MATTFEKVGKIIAEELGVDEEDVVPSASLIEDLNADSFALVEITIHLEDEFEIGEISEGDAEKIHTVQDIIDYLLDKGIEDE